MKRSHFGITQQLKQVLGRRRTELLQLREVIEYELTNQSTKSNIIEDANLTNDTADLRRKYNTEETGTESTSRKTSIASNLLSAGIERDKGGNHKDEKAIKLIDSSESQVKSMSPPHPSSVELDLLTHHLCDEEDEGEGKNANFHTSKKWNKKIEKLL